MGSTILVVRRFTFTCILLGCLLTLAALLPACSDANRPYFYGGGSSTALSISRVSRLAWSQDGEHILFSSGGVHGVYVVDRAGRELRAFPEWAPPIGDRRNHPGTFAPALSPDGTRVAYNAFAPLDNIVIETAAFDGTDVRLLTPLKPSRDEEGDLRSPSGNTSVYPVWSPDGKQIAFTRDFGKTDFSRSPDNAELPLGRGIFIMDADGSNLRALAPSVSTLLTAPIQPVFWSPDGNRLALVGYDPAVGGYYPFLYTVRPDGSELVRIGDLRVYRFQGMYEKVKVTYSPSDTLAWSPDGRRLAFLGVEIDAEGNKRFALYTAQADGSELVKVSPPGYGGPILAWSPDGAWLAFTNGAQVNVVRPDGAELRQVASGHGGPLVWTPDGEEILIGELGYAVRPDGSGLRAWASGGVPDVARTAWSPDGSRLAVLTYNRGLKLFTIERDGTNKRLLARGSAYRIVAEHSDWRDVSDDIAGCAELYEDNPGLVEDCQTLLRIRDTLAGDSLLSWRADIPIRDWEGVSVEGDPPRVRRLVLSTGSHTDTPWLTGVIPPELGNLSELEWLNLGFSALTGSIPAELGNLSKLEGLRLMRNYLTGSIPPELGNLVNLKSLDLRDNMLSGDVPPELGSLENLESLQLHGNNLSGCVPAVLADRLGPHPGIDYCE